MWSVAGRTTLRQNGTGGGEPCAVTIRDIMILLGFDIDEQSQNEAENSVKSLKDMATKALGAIGVAFSVAGAASFVAHGLLWILVAGEWPHRTVCLRLTSR